MAKLSKPKLPVTKTHPLKPSSDQLFVVRFPKPNLQFIVLCLIAIITLFQTFQLVRISATANSSSTKIAPAASTTKNTTSEPAAPASDSEEPASMVGGC